MDLQNLRICYVFLWKKQKKLLGTFEISLGDGPTLWRGQILVIASWIIGRSSACSTVCSDWKQRNIKSLCYCPFVKGIHQVLVDYPHKGTVMHKIFPFYDVIMRWRAQDVGGASTRIPNQNFCAAISTHHTHHPPHDPPHQAEAGGGIPRLIRHSETYVTCISCLEFESYLIIVTLARGYDNLKTRVCFLLLIAVIA